MTRIICLGNRHVPGDAAGPRVCDRLQRRSLPEGVTAVDGGIGGLNLLRFVEGAEHVVFVDAVSGFGEPGEVVVVGADEAAREAPDAHGHGAGLGYLLRVMPAVLGDATPRVDIVGVETPAEEQSIARAVAVALTLAEGSDRVAAPARRQTQDAGGERHPL